MAELFASGRVIDVIFALMVLELAALIWIRRRSAGGVPLVSLLVNLAAGAALLLALRGALTGSSWQFVAAVLIVALAMHLADLAFRWNSRGSLSMSRNLSRRTPVKNAKV